MRCGSALSICVLVSLYAEKSILQVSAHTSVDWCSMDCFTNKGKIAKNTMCTYKHQTSTKTCKNIKDSLTPNKRKEILHYHNEFRNEIAAGQKNWPSAGNMRQMSWDATLEMVAMRWAVQCKPDHDDCRRTPEYQDVGQNYGMLATSTVHPESSKASFEGWIGWMSKTNTTLILAYQPGDWGVFTQVIWANTYKLGCSQVQFTETQNGVDWKRTVVVCNYGPAGNVVTSRIYEEGKPCSKCPRGTYCKPSSQYQNLCALPGDETRAVPIARMDRSGGSRLGIVPSKLSLPSTLLIFMLSTTK